MKALTRSGAAKPSRRTLLLHSASRAELHNCARRGTARRRVHPYVTILLMLPTDSSDGPAANPFTGADVLAILRERGWLVAEPSPEQYAWCERAASMLGGHAADRAALGELLGLVFQYAARDVLRQVALLLLEGAPLTSERFKEIVTVLKESMELRGRELFHPIRLALAGRAGEGELDRVILLLDEAAALSFAVPVKSAHARILEFCSALD